MIVDVKKALIHGFTEGTVETIEMIPGLGILIEGVRAYSESIEEQQREIFVRTIVERIEVLENVFNDKWFKTSEGIDVTKK